MHYRIIKDAPIATIDKDMSAQHVVYLQVYALAASDSSNAGVKICLDIGQIFINKSKDYGRKQYEYEWKLVEENQHALAEVWKTRQKKLKGQIPRDFTVYVYRWDNDGSRRI